MVRIMSLPSSALCFLYLCLPAQSRSGLGASGSLISATTANTISYSGDGYSFNCVSLDKYLGDALYTATLHEVLRLTGRISRDGVGGEAMTAIELPAHGIAAGMLRSGSAAVDRSQSPPC